MSCRTPLLGGHLQVCDHCGREIPFYNSCRNRHCPKCQSLEQTRWVEAQTRSLLPVEYSHLVFTVPTALHPFFLAERRGSYALLFEAAIETLHDVCRRRLGALPGTIAVLHTWTQTLAFHPHVHCIVTGGGLATSGDRWIASRPGFLVPVRVLSRVFRGKLLDRFDRALQKRTLDMGASLGRRLLGQAASKEWVVYSKASLAGPAQVLRYLGRYTHRIAIGNERLVALKEGRVTFRYRDRAAAPVGSSPSKRGTSSNDSFCTCSLVALSVSGTSVSRPTAVARVTSREYDSCSMHPHRRSPTPIASPGRTSIDASPDVILLAAPTATAAHSASSLWLLRTSTREDHERTAL